VIEDSRRLRRRRAVQEKSPALTRAGPSIGYLIIRKRVVFRPKAIRSAAIGSRAAACARDVMHITKKLFVMDRINAPTRLVKRRAEACHNAPSRGAS
jgi:hypothetical protein